MNVIYKFLLFILFSAICYAQTPTGKWTFANEQLPEKADVGKDLILVGSRDVNYDQKLAKNFITMPKGSYYKCLHGISPTEGNYVNEYTMLFDFRVKTAGQWYAFFQTDLTNTTDAEIFVNQSMQIGISGTGYIAKPILPNEWYRLVIKVRNGETFDYYLDGELALTGAPQAVDGRYALAKDTVLLFADENGEDNDIDIAQIQFFNKALTKTEIKSLGKFTHSIFSGITPYLESPTDTTMIIGWNYLASNSSYVEYYKDGSNSKTKVTAKDSMVKETGYWYKAQLKGLTPNTKYHYYCVCDGESSDTFAFYTYPNIKTPKEHLRMILIGDTESSKDNTTRTVDSIISKLKELYGDEYYNEVNLVFHLGDVSGTNAYDNYYSEYFVPFSGLTGNIPFMTAVGNYEFTSKFYDIFFDYSRFEESKGQRYYVFKLGPIAINVLNSNNKVISQLQWYKKKIEAQQLNDSIMFIATFKHHPGYSEIWPDGNNTWISKYVWWLESVSSKHVIDAAGHSHCYERGALDTGNTFTVISGGGGSGLDRWNNNQKQCDYGMTEKSLDIYNWVLLDFNTKDTTMKASVYSLGNPSKPADNVLVDSFEYSVKKKNYKSPISLSPQGTINNPIIVNADIPLKNDSLDCIRIQLSESEDFELLVIDTLYTLQNYYKDSGAPDYTPVNISENLKLSELKLADSSLCDKKTYYYRLKYRDINLRWSEYSPTYQISIDLLDVDDNSNQLYMYNFNLENSLLEINSSVYSKVQIVICDILGRIYLDRNFDIVPGINSLELENKINGPAIIKIICDKKVDSFIVR